MGYRSTSSSRLCPVRWSNFKLCLSLDPKDVPSVCVLHWLGSVSTRFEQRAKSTIKQYFFAREPLVVYSTNKLLCETNKDLLLALQKSNVIYQFSCHCDSLFVGLLKAAEKYKTTRSQIYPLLLFPKTHTSCPSVQIFPPRLIPKLLLLI